MKPDEITLRINLDYLASTYGVALLDSVEVDRSSAILTLVLRGQRKAK